MASKGKRPVPAEASSAHVPPQIALTRRPPAYRSLSLLHNKRKTSPNDRSDSSGNSQRLNTSDGTDSPSSLRPGKESSGESSNADKWFEKSNNEVRDQSTSFADDEPPFFMRNSSSSETPPEMAALRQQAMRTSDSSSLPLRTDMLRIGTDGSSNDDFRGVIDDLTIENKKLRRRLKRYEKFHDAHLKDEKLFEVRIHGLPPAKKRELEETLRNFAASLNNIGFSADTFGGMPHHLLTAGAASVYGQKGGSSEASGQFGRTSSTSGAVGTQADSAYKSMSTSATGPGSAEPDQLHKGTGQSIAMQKPNIQSYLHHIPSSHESRQNPATMSERAKKKYVARRLEQLFTGKGAAEGRHLHPLQQQQVSRSAARRDRNTAAAMGQRTHEEGTREAYIMRGLQLGEVPADNMTRVDAHPSTANAIREEQPQDSEMSGTEQPGPVEQRPTRPLDLDPHRAQIAADNLDYIRHLGFSPLDPNAGTPPQDNHGWIYLNVLTNMAQLHTLNVTAEFIRKAITEYSSIFEMSGDGRKIRWVGDRASSTARSESASGRAGLGTPDGVSPNKRPRLLGRNSTRSAISDKDKLAYTPLLFQRDNSDEMSDSTSSDDDSTFSMHPAQITGDSSAMTSSGMHTVSIKKQKLRDDGPIIFYKSTGFITDLSGERFIGNNAQSQYVTATALPLGLPNRNEQPIEKRGPLATAKDLPEAMDLTDNPIPASLELAFPVPSPPDTDVDASPGIELEMSGIDGIFPADHFSIDVKSRHAPVEKAAASPSVKRKSAALRPKLAEILRSADLKQSNKKIVREHQIISAQQKELPPSELPPALSFAFADADSDDDESAGDNDEMTWDPQLSDGDPPAAAPQPVEIHYASSDEEDEDDDDSEDDDEDDGTIDMLAAARQADPEAILAREREYDANMADRLAEEIPAGSSAATAGGGSGYASPAGSNVAADEHARRTRQARRDNAKAAKALRASASSSAGVRDSDSMDVQMKTPAVRKDEAVGEDDSGEISEDEGDDDDDDDADS